MGVEHKDQPRIGASPQEKDVATSADEDLTSGPQPSKTGLGQGPESLLYLQRTVGNQAVNQMLRISAWSTTQSHIQRQPSPGGPTTPNAGTTPAQSLDALYQAAVSSGNWPAAATHLNGFNDTDIAARVTSLSPANRAAMLSGIPAWAHRVRSRVLDALFQAAVSSGNWSDAARHLNGFNDPDILARIQALSDTQRQLLRQGAVTVSTGASQTRITNAIDSLDLAIARMYGSLSISQTLVSGTATTGYQCSVTITFTPTAQVNAISIAFVQNVRVVSSGTGASADPRPNFVNRRTRSGWTIDRLPSRRSGWYGYNNTGVPGGTVTPGRGPSPLVNAVMHDTPQWNILETRWDFETCAIAKEGPDGGRIYGCIMWGFTVDAANQLTAHPVRHSRRPSADFGDAVAAWNTQASGPVGNRNDPSQQPLGPFDVAPAPHVP
jgi:hypothetical protein